MSKQCAVVKPVTDQNWVHFDQLAHEYPEHRTVVQVAPDNIDDAQAFVTACEICSRRAELAFDYVLDAMTGCSPTETDYLLMRPARCPRCGSQITPKTLVAVN